MYSVMERILLVDDEEDICNLLTVYLKNSNYDVVCFGTGTEALEFLSGEEVDCAVLDVMLPDMDGFTVCRKIRELKYFPVIMLTAKNEEADVLNGLMLGADDYITKPFKAMEVLARIRAQIRRYKTYDRQGEEERETDEISIRGLYMNGENHRATLYDEPLDLTPLEFSILFYLGKRQGKVVSSEELFEAVWQERFWNQNNTVMTHIGRIREKMKESAKKPKFIRTVWGVGYTID